jgi:hypothetical protein
MLWPLTCRQIQHSEPVWYLHPHHHHHARRQPEAPVVIPVRRWLSSCPSGGASSLDWHPWLCFFSRKGSPLQLVGCAFVLLLLLLPPFHFCSCTSFISWYPWLWDSLHCKSSLSLPRYGIGRLILSGATDRWVVNQTFNFCYKGTFFLRFWYVTHMDSSMFFLKIASSLRLICHETQSA